MAITSLQRCMASLLLASLYALMLPQHSEGFEAFLANATSPSISPNTPHMIDRYYKPSFDFTAEICNRSPLTKSCTIDSSCRGKIVVGVYGDYAAAIEPCPPSDLFYECKPIGCAGLIEVRQKSPEAAHWIASSTWSTRRQDNYRHRVVPRVVMAVTPSGDTGVKASDVEWIMEHWNDTGLIIHMWSGEHNAADDVLVSPLFLFVNIFANLQSSVNNYQAFTKIIAFHRSRKNPSKALFWVLLPELFANIMRVLTLSSLISPLITPIFGSWGMFFSWDIFRIILTAPFDFGNISNAAITLILFDTYSAISASSTAQWKRARYITYGIAGGTAGMAAASLILTVYSAIAYYELVPAQITTGIILLLSLPLTWAFIRFGGKVAREMRKGSSSLKMSEEKRKDREQFGRRVKLSGIAMIVNIIAMVSFVMFSAHSSSHFLNLMQAMTLTANFVSGAQILAVRVPRDPRRTIAPVAAVGRSLPKTNNTRSLNN